MASNPSIISRGNINGSYELRPGGTADTDQYRIADIDWITTNYYTYITGDQTSNRCPSPNQIFAEPHITTTSPTIVNSSTVNDGGSVSNNVGVASEVGMCLSTSTSTPTQYDTVIPQYSNVNVTAGYSWSGNLSYVFTPGVLYYMRAYVIYNGIYFYGTSVNVNTSVTTTTTTLGAGYYDCGYGCQYYAYYPGCTPCNPALIPQFGSFGFYSFNVHPTYFYVENDLSNPACTILTRGICYSTINTTPTISDSTTTMAATTGNFSTLVSGLSTTTTYYVRGYASNCNGLAYSSNTLTITTTAF